MSNEFEMDQAEFTGRFCARPENFAWFLGAGSSATAGIPTATDLARTWSFGESLIPVKYDVALQRRCDEPAVRRPPDGSHRPGYRSFDCARVDCPDPGSGPAGH